MRSSAERAEPPDYKARFEAMVYGYGEIGAAIGIPDDEAPCANGPDVILEYIERLKDAAPQPSAKALTDYSYQQLFDAIAAATHVSAGNVAVSVKDFRAALLADHSRDVTKLTAEQPKCQTCNGHGMIGGPSYYQPDEGGERCPDCAEQPSEDKR
jgi:hypothetical protein